MPGEREGAGPGNDPMLRSLRGTQKRFPCVGMYAKGGRFCHLLPSGMMGTGEMDIRYLITRYHHRELQAP